MTKETADMRKKPTNPDLRANKGKHQYTMMQVTEAAMEAFP